MNRRELKRLSRADLLEMLIIKCRENEQLRAELEEAKALAARRPAEPSVTDGQIGLVLRALKTAAEQYLENMGSRADAPAAEENVATPEEEAAK